MADDRQITERMVFSNAGTVSIEGYVQTVMQTVLHPPLSPHRVRKRGHVY